MADHEGKDEKSAQHHLPASPHQGHHDDVGQGPAPGPHEEAGSFHSLQAEAVHHQQGPDDQILSSVDTVVPAQCIFTLYRNTLLRLYPCFVYFFAL